MSFQLQVTVIGATGAELAKGCLTEPSPTHEEAYAKQLELWNNGVMGSLTFRNGQQCFIVGADLVASSVIKFEIVDVAA